MLDSPEALRRRLLESSGHHTDQVLPGGVHFSTKPHIFFTIKMSTINISTI